LNRIDKLCFKASKTARLLTLYSADLSKSECPVRAEALTVEGSAWKPQLLIGAAIQRTDHLLPTDIPRRVAKLPMIVAGVLDRIATTPRAPR